MRLQKISICFCVLGSIIQLCFSVNNTKIGNPVYFSNLNSTSSEHESSSKNILFLLPLSSKSHKHVFEPLIRGLAAKGHQITVIAATKSTNMPENVREIVIVKDEHIFDVWQDPLENRKNGKLSNMFLDISFAIDVCNKVYDSEEMTELIQTHKNKFDLMYVDLILNQCFYGLLKYFEAPFITVATLPPWNAMSSQLGSHLPSSLIGISIFNFPAKMNFIQRATNQLVNFVLPVVLRVVYNSKLEKVYQQRFGSDYPTTEEIEANASMMLTNSHFSINDKLPLLPDIVEVGGMHLKPAKPLPREFEDFLADANDGFIVFSLGSIVRARSMPEETRKSFLRVFGKLKQKVLWKWEIDSMPDLPPNVRLSKWLPQQDLLGHPKSKLFMSHGGLLSVQEAMYHGVPILGLPVFGDQDGNIMKAQDLGFAMFQEILNVDEDELLAKITQLIAEPRFAQKAKQLSKVMQDQPQSPLERAIFWSEYVMRHKGAPHLRSPARDLSWIQYHSIDVAVFYLSIAYITVKILMFCLTSIFSIFPLTVQPSDKNMDKKNN